VTPPTLDRVLTCYRIGDPDGIYKIFDATGSKLHPGRWNRRTSPVLYAAEHYSTAMLEKLARANGILPPNQHYISITIPPGISYEILDPAALPGWDSASMNVSRSYGHTWQQSKRSLLLIVPSVVARLEHDYLINLEHPDALRVTHSRHRPVWWDARLFPKPTTP